jgi:hypothetical protein
MILASVSGVVLPPEFVNGLIIFGLTLLTVLGGMATAFGFYFKSYMKAQAKKNEALVEQKVKEVNAQQELKEAERRIELNKMQLEASNNTEAVKLAIEIARSTTSRLDKAEATIASQDKQLQEARTNSIARDQKIGELQALLSKTASERDQERIQREQLETQRNEALAQVEAMKQKIADLEAKTASMDDLIARVKELEKRQEERHELANQLQAKLNEIEMARMTAERERDALKVELEAERRKSQQFVTPIEPPVEGGAQ